MYTLACKSFGINCDAVVKDESLDGVVQKAKAHSGQDHPEAVKKMQEMGPEAALALILSKIKLE